MTNVPEPIAARLREDPEDAGALAVLTDWMEENGHAAEVTWMLDQRADMAALFRSRQGDVDPLRGVPSAWLVLRNGLITGFTVPERRAARAVPTTDFLARSPLAVTLTSLHAPSGQDAAAWLPVLRRLPHIRRIRIGPDVDPRLLEGFPELTHLEITTVVRPNHGSVALGPLHTLALDVRGRRLDVLDALEIPAVQRLVLEAPDWEDVPTGPLERFYARTDVGSLEAEGRARAALPRPASYPTRSPAT
ncbi:MAG: hypothetical protein H6734_11035 [Alphaproteobacteria bacterium]|nr:hypothetical protein [Alphaproteobacteria bacterium]